MPNPDHDPRRGDAGSKTLFVFIVFNILLLLNVILGAIFPAYKEGKLYSLFINMVKTTDNSPSCRYDQDCDYPN